MTTAAGRLRAPAGHQGSGNPVRRPLQVPYQWLVHPLDDEPDSA